MISRNFPSVILDELFVRRKMSEGDRNFDPASLTAEPTVAQLANGNFVVLYRVDSGQLGAIEGGFGPRPQTAFEARIYAPDGTVLVDSVPIGNLSDINDQTSAEITATSDGGFFVVWQRQLNDGFNRIEMAGFDANGAVTTPELIVTDIFSDTIRGATDKQTPEIIELTNGNLVVSWSEQGTRQQSFSNFKIIAKDGTVVRDADLISPETYNNFYLAEAGLQLTALSDGGFAAIVGGQNDRSGSVPDPLLLKVFNADGSASAATTEIAPSNTVQGATDFVELAGGALAVSFASKSDDGTTISATVLETDGTVLSRLSVDAPADSDTVYRLPQATALPDGNFLLAWISDGGDSFLLPTTPLGFTDQILGQVYAPNGRLVKDTTVLAPILEDLSNEAATKLAQGEISEFDVNTAADGSVSVTWITDGTAKITRVDLDDGSLPNRAPIFADPQTDLVRPENVPLSYEMITRDLDGDTVSYDITGGADAGAFVIDASNGTLDFAAPPTFAGVDAENSLEVEVTARDGKGGTISKTLSIEITTAAEYDPDGPTPADYEVITQLTDADDRDNSFNAFGTEGRDWIEGKGGSDDISGGFGDDYIVAGSGNDFNIKGGQGSDIFQFKTGDAQIRIRDFEDGLDLIHLIEGLEFEDLRVTSFTIDGITNTRLTTASGDRLTLDGIAPAQIDSSDFLPSGAVPEQLPFFSSTFPRDLKVIDGNTEIDLSELALSRFVRAYDPQGDELSYTISGGADAALFSVDENTGLFSFQTPVDIADPADADGDNVYEFELTAADPGGNSDSKLVEVTAIADPGIIEITSPVLDIDIADYDEQFYIVSSADTVRGTPGDDWINMDEAGGAGVASGDGDDLIVLNNRGTRSGEVIDGGRGADIFVTNFGRYKFENFEPGVDKIALSRTPFNPIYTTSSEIVDGKPAIVVSIGRDDFIFFGGDDAVAQPSDFFEANFVQQEKNLPPVILDDKGFAAEFSATFSNIQVAENQTFVVDIDAFDLEGDALRFELWGRDADIFNIDAGTGVVSFKIAPDFETLEPAFFSDYSFGVLVSDGAGNFDRIAASVKVTDVVDETGANEIPVAVDDSYTTVQDTSLAVAASSGVLSNDTDADGDTLAAVLISDAGNGAVMLNENGSFDYVANAGFVGSDSFTYAVADGNGGSDEATVVITVTAAPTGDGPQPSDYANQFFGDAGDNPIQGTADSDWIEGFGGNDKINGGAGEDYIIAGPGRDGFVRGGDGADIFQFGPGDQYLGLFDFELGVDQIALVGGLSFDDFAITQSSFNGITSTFLQTAAGDRLRLRDVSQDEVSSAQFITFDGPPAMPTAPRPEDYDNQFFGDAGDNPIQGTNQSDWIAGGAGNDKINGNDGDDYIIAGTGRDGYVRGGAGADIFEFGNGDTEIYIYDFEIGIDQIALRGGLDYDDLTPRDAEFNGITSAGYRTEEGDRLKIREVSIDDLSADDFIMV